MCLYCNHEIEWQNKNMITDHLKTNKHLECKLNSTKAMKLITLEEVLSRRDKKQEMILDFVEMMLKVNIPLHKSDK